MKITGVRDKKDRAEERKVRKREREIDTKERERDRLGTLPRVGVRFSILQTVFL